MRKTAALIFAFFTFSNLFAQIFGNDKNDFHIAIEPVFSYTSGFLGETWFYSKYEDDSKKKSYLEWDKKLFLYGAEISSSYKRFHFDTQFLTSIQNLKSGEMSDSDWKNTSDYSMKTTYSVGDNKAVENYSFQASIYFDFFPEKPIVLSPVFQFQYDYDSFAREEAEGWYSDGKHWWYDESSTHYPYYNSQTGKRYKLAEIDYYRHSFYAWTGFKLHSKLTKRLKFDFSALVSPYAYFYSLDTHWAQDKSTKEKFKKNNRQIQSAFFPSMKIEAKADFSLTKVFDLTFGASGLLGLKVNRGKWFQDYFGDFKQDDFYDSGEDSGSFMQYLSARIGCKIKVR